MRALYFRHRLAWALYVAGCAALMVAGFLVPGHSRAHDGLVLAAACLFSEAFLLRPTLHVVCEAPADAPDGFQLSRFRFWKKRDDTSREDR